jgi:protein-disulfide isomerase
MFTLPILFFVLGLGSGYLIWGRTISKPGGTAQANYQPEPTLELTVPEKLTRYDINIEGAPSYGPEDAAITLVEFSDYQCPYCKQWYDEVLARLLEEYPDQLRFVYRDFPLTSIHSEAISAAVAARCAGEQEKYWEYHNALFTDTYGLSSDAYPKYAADLGLKMDDFNTCVQEDRYRDAVLASMEEAQSQFYVGSTPTFFLNGIPIEGALPYTFFKQVIDLELAGKLPKE